MAGDDRGRVEGRRAVVRDAVVVGLATGTYGVAFGALAVAAGLSVLQACALSALMFTGASQFALVGVVEAGGSPLAGLATAALVGSRNALYGLRLSALLRSRGMRRLGAAQLVIDESTAMAVRRAAPRAARLAFWATGVSVFVFWNVATLLGAVGARALPDPKALGLDAVAPAAYLALLAPRMRGREPWLLALAAAAVALAALPFVPAGVPVLLAGAVAVAWGAARPHVELAAAAGGAATAGEEAA